MPKVQNEATPGPTTEFQPYARAKQPRQTEKVTTDQLPAIVVARTEEEMSALSCEEFGLSKGTRESYKRYIARGKMFLAECVKQELERGEEAPGGLDIELLATAFDKPPNKHSAEALELFLTHKCLVEECGESTATTIHAAFAWYWDNMDGDRYAGEYSYDNVKDEVRGCPARAPLIKEHLKAIKARSRAVNSTVRTHAEAITIEELAQMMRWSEAQCPPDRLGKPEPDDQVQKFITKHAFMRAFVSTAFTLWMGNFELCKLRSDDVSEDLRQPPYDLPYFNVNLKNRNGSDALEGKTYKIYKQAIHEIDMYTHLRAWQAHFRAVLGRNGDEDGPHYIFPYIAPNGIAHPQRLMSHEKIQALVSEFTHNAGLTKHYSTHCFRRGGAQYRFMFAPPSQRWPLDMVRWWGGWAEGEQNHETLLRYLINELRDQESNYCYRLNPLRSDASMGEDRPATVGDLREMQAVILDAIQQLQAAITNHAQSSCLNCWRQQVPAQPATPSIASTTSTLSDGNCSTPASSESPPDVTVNQLHVASPINSSPGKPPKCRIPGIYIPDLPKGDWKKAIEQWHFGDPAAGLKPLKDWEPSEYGGRMRKAVATKRQSRQLIAMEYDYYGSDDEAFVAAYPMANNGTLHALMDAIREARNRRRCSKNGTPQQRKQWQQQQQQARQDGNV